jgi:hypothetical protein
MASTLQLPDNFDKADLLRWLKREGEPFVRGEPLAGLKLDDQVMVLTAEQEGILLRHYVDPSETFNAGGPLAALGAPGEMMGYDPQVVRCVRVTVQLGCGECGNFFPLNGLVNRVRCTLCAESHLCSPKFWRDVVWEHVDKCKEPRQWDGASWKGDHGTCNVSAAGFPPLCRACYAVIPWEGLAPVWEATKDGQPTQVFCPECGEGHRARRPPDWAVAERPDLLMLIGETAKLDDAPSTVSKPVIFKCPSCLAGLDIDGARRIVSCRYCDSDIYLPDDLWMHLNPTVKRARWWMLLRP